MGKSMWFNCQNGEYHDGDTNVDFLEMKKADGTVLYIGEGTYKDSDNVTRHIATSRWTSTGSFMISRANEHQNNPDGYTAPELLLFRAEYIYRSGRQGRDSRREKGDARR